MLPATSHRVGKKKKKKKKKPPQKTKQKEGENFFKERKAARSPDEAVVVREVASVERAPVFQCLL